MPLERSGNFPKTYVEKATADVIDDIKESVEVIQESNVYHEETSSAGDIVEFNQVIPEIDKETFSDLDDRMEEECAKVIESRKEICLDLKVVHLEVDLHQTYSQTGSCVCPDELKGQTWVIV